MRHEGWLLVLSVILTAVTGWFVLTAPPPKPVIISWPACEDKSNCGECEVMLKPGYLMPICEQQGCALLNADPPVTDPPSSMNMQVKCKDKQLSLYRRKAWSDCNGDGVADCECWTWYLREKDNPNIWHIGIDCGGE